MATTTTLSPNIKLRIDSNLTANAKYNLSRIDDLGAVYLLDNNETVNIRSKIDINLKPADASTGGAGVGGSVNIGSPGSPIEALNVYAAALNIDGALELSDTASTGTKSLQLFYKSDINGSVDNTANRALRIDLDAADRNLVLGGDVQLMGGNLSLTLTGNTSLIAPLTGTLSTVAGNEILTNKTISASANTISNITNTSISSSAAIAYSKLNLSGSIVNADINSAAAVAYSKLALTNSIVNSDISASASIVYSKLSLSGSIVNNDIQAGAGIIYSKLNLFASISNSDISASAAISRSKLATGTASAVVINDGSGFLSSESVLSTTRGGTGTSSSATFPSSGTILTDTNSSTVSNKSLSGSSNTFSNIAYAALTLGGSIVNADINASAAIAYSKLALTGGIVNADVNASAAISGSKISPAFGSQTVSTTDKFRLDNGSYTTDIQPADSGQTSNLTLKLPPDSGTSGYVLSTDGTGSTNWIAVAGTGTVTSVALSAPSALLTVSGSPVTTAGTLTLALATQVANKVLAGPTFGNPNAAPTFRSLESADLPADVVYKDQAVTLTNKLIDGDSNTLQNISLSNLKTVGGNANKLVKRNNSGVVVDAAVGTLSDAGALAGLTQLDVDSLRLNGNTISSTDTNGPVIIDPNGSGTTQIVGVLELDTSLVLQDPGAGTSTITLQAPTLSGSYTLTLPTTDGNDGQVLSTDGSGALAWTNAPPTSFRDDWDLADGTTLAVTHNLGTKDIDVTIRDNADDQIIGIDSIVATDINTVTLTASVAPNVSGWRVIIIAV